MVATNFSLAKASNCKKKKTQKVLRIRQQVGATLTCFAGKRYNFFIISTAMQQSHSLDHAELAQQDNLQHVNMFVC